jgi:hypothetical protein
MEGPHPLPPSRRPARRRQPALTDCPNASTPTNPTSREDLDEPSGEQDIFRAVADESRRTILDALAERTHNFQELHALLEITKGAV